MRTRRHVLGPTVAALLTLSGCGGGTPSTPTSPSPVTAPSAPSPPTPASSRFALSGVVAEDDAGGTPIGDAKVEITEGANAGHSTVTDSAGKYRLADLEQGSFPVRVSATGMDAEIRNVTLTSDQALDVRLRKSVSAPFRGVVGVVQDGVSDAPLGLVTLQVDGLGDFTSERDGSFRIACTDGDLPRAVKISGPSSVERRTHIRVPGPETRLTLFPASFDLPAFDQMFRLTGGLQRWVETPRLVVQTRVLQYTSTSATEYTALGQQMSDADAARLVEDLQWGLPQLTGGRFSGFAGQRTENATPGDRIMVARPGEIVVARYEGLQAALGFWGYGRWATDGQGTVLGGIVMLDAGFDASGSQFQRSLRVHELGHALGYNHVTGRDSAMNASARLEPNDFDRSAAKIAFQRAPWNRTPDIDPDPYMSNVRTGAIIWAAGAR